MQCKLCRLVSPNLLLSILPSASCAANCQQVACCLAKMNWQQFPGVVELRLRKIRAWRRISLLWRSSRFSRSSVFQTLTFSGGESTITAPGIPLMLVVHQTRRVSGVQPIFGTMEQIAAHWESYSP